MDAGLAPNGGPRSRLGVVMGNTFGGAQQMERGFDAMAHGDEDRLSPYFVPGALCNMAAAITAMTLGAGGPNRTINEACASGASAIGLGLQMLRTGEADAVVAGGCEAPLTHLLFSGYHSLRATSARNDEPERASRPFDRDRDGFVPAEGAAAVVLETRDSAARRGARAYGTLAGFGSSCDAFHMTHPEPNGDGATRCMRLAIEDAHLEPADIDEVNAHGTATRLNDAIEARAITRVFGNAAADLPVTANKSLMGHSVGACGAIEAVFSILSLRDQVVPPTANLEHPDPECGLRGVTPCARAMPLRAVLTNSFGFGGANASLVFRRP
jgi:3-oxoacyl-[acyl-carrier-protein] synthase II